MAGMCRVRFHLGRGENYMKWQLRGKDGGVVYLDPETVRMSLKKCTLKNNKRIAREINEGANKSVCSWILCEEATVSLVPPEGTEIMYNPRKNPFWTDGVNDLDGMEYDQIVSDGRRLYAR